VVTNFHPLESSKKAGYEKTSSSLENILRATKE